MSVFAPHWIRVEDESNWRARETQEASLSLHQHVSLGTLERKFEEMLENDFYLLAIGLIQKVGILSVNDADRAYSCIVTSILSKVRDDDRLYIGLVLKARVAIKNICNPQMQTEQCRALDRRVLQIGTIVEEQYQKPLR